jgi:hypothetical protein
MYSKKKDITWLKEKPYKLLAQEGQSEPRSDRQTDFQGFGSLFQFHSCRAASITTNRSPSPPPAPHTDSHSLNQHVALTTFKTKKVQEKTLLNQKGLLCPFHSTCSTFARCLGPVASQPTHAHTYLRIHSNYVVKLCEVARLEGS